MPSFPPTAWTHPSAPPPRPRRRGPEGGIIVGIVAGIPAVATASFVAFALLTTESPTARADRAAQLTAVDETSAHLQLVRDAVDGAGSFVECTNVDTRGPAMKLSYERLSFLLAPAGTRQPRATTRELRFTGGAFTGQQPLADYRETQRFEAKRVTKSMRDLTARTTFVVAKTEETVEPRMYAGRLVFVDTAARCSRSVLLDATGSDSVSLQSSIDRSYESAVATIDRSLRVE